MVIGLQSCVCEVALRVISHMRLRTRGHYTLSTLIGGKGRAGPNSLHTTLEGPTEYRYVNARWVMIENRCLYYRTARIVMSSNPCE